MSLFSDNITLFYIGRIIILLQRMGVFFLNGYRGFTFKKSEKIQSSFRTGLYFFALIMNDVVFGGNYILFILYFKSKMIVL